MSSPRPAAVAVGVLAAVAAFVAVPAVAHGAPREDPADGVVISVIIEPLELGTPGGGALPATGAELPTALIMLALVLIAAGMGFIAWRRARISPSAVYTSPSPGPYYVVSGRRTWNARSGLSSAAKAPAPTRGDGDDAIERGGS